MLRGSEEASIKYSKNNKELKEALDQINKKLKKIQEEKIYNLNEQEYFEYSYLLNLQREATIKMKKKH